MHLSATQAALLVAVPVLLGSLARIPIGMLTDRFGGRLIFSALMLLVCVPAFITPMARSYEQLLLGGFFLGLAGASFAVGVGFVSRWFSAEQQGGALGVYGLGNIGQSAAVFLGPVIGASAGWQNVFRGTAASTPANRSRSGAMNSRFPRPASGTSTAANHQGYFSIRDGSVLQGPPTRPLPRVVLERRGEELIAIRMEPEV